MRGLLCKATTAPKDAQEETNKHCLSEAQPAALSSSARHAAAPAGQWQRRSNAPPVRLLPPRTALGPHRCHCIGTLHPAKGHTGLRGSPGPPNSHPYLTLPRPCPGAAAIVLTYATMVWVTLCCSSHSSWKAARPPAHTPVWPAHALAHAPAHASYTRTQHPPRRTPLPSPWSLPPRWQEGEGVRSVRVAAALDMPTMPQQAPIWRAEPGLHYPSHLGSTIQVAALSSLAAASHEGLAAGLAAAERASARIELSCLGCRRSTRWAVGR